MQYYVELQYVKKWSRAVRLRWGAGRWACSGTHWIQDTVACRDLRTQALAGSLRREDQVVLAFLGENFFIPSLSGSGSQPTQALSCFPPRRIRHPEKPCTWSAALVWESHGGSDLRFFEKQIIHYLSKSPQRTFLSFSGRKNELLYELFQHVSELLNVTICCKCYNLIYKLGLSVKHRLSLNSQMIMFQKFICRWVICNSESLFPYILARAPKAYWFLL